MATFILAVIVIICLYLLIYSFKESSMNLAIAKACLIIDILLLFTFILLSLTTANPAIGRVIEIIFILCLVGMIVFGTLGFLDASKKSNIKEKNSSLGVIITGAVLVVIVCGLILLTYVGTHSG